MAVGEQLGDHLGVAIGALGLEDRALVVVEVQPLAERRGSARRSRASSAPGRYLRSAGRVCLPARAPAASCTARSARRRYAGPRLGTERTEHVRTLINHANWRPRITGGRSGQGRRARRREGLSGDPDLQPVAAHVAAHRVRGRRLRRLPQGDEAQPGQGGADPCRVSGQLRVRGRRDPRQVPRLARSSHCASARASAPPASSCIPGSAKQGDVRQAIKRAGKVIKEALSETDGCPLHLEDTAGAGGTLGRSFEELAELLTAAGGGKRLGRVPGLLPSARLGLRHPDGRRPHRGDRRVRPRGGHQAAGVAAPQRLPDAAGLQPRPPRQHRHGRARRARLRRVPVRAPVRQAPAA